MKKVLIALIIFHSWLFAQTIPFDWASKDNGYHNMVIDSQHRIHLVWIEYEQQPWSSGTVYDSPNCIKYSCYDESRWSYPIVIDSFCQSFKDRIELIIDNQDRLYLFYILYTLDDTGNLIPVPFYRIMENGKWSAKQNVYLDYPNELNQLKPMAISLFSLAFTNSQDSLFFCDHNTQIIKIMDCRTGKWFPWKKMPFQYSYLVDDILFSMEYGYIYGLNRESYDLAMARSFDMGSSFRDTVSLGVGNNHIKPDVLFFRTLNQELHLFWVEEQISKAERDLMQISPHQPYCSMIREAVSYDRGANWIVNPDTVLNIPLIWPEPQSPLPCVLTDLCVFEYQDRILMNCRYGTLRGSNCMVVQTESHSYLWKINLELTVPNLSETEFGLRDGLLYTFIPLQADNALWPYERSQAIVMVQNLGGSLAGQAEPEQKSNDNFCRVYPNPCSNRLWVDLKCQETVPLTLSIYDLNGRKIYTQSGIVFPGNRQFVIDLQNLSISTGIHFLAVTGLETPIYKKFTVLH